MPFRYALILLILLGGLGGAAWLGSGIVSYVRSNTPVVRAERALARHQPREALIELRTATRDTPRDSKVPLLLSKVHTQLGDIAAAERDLKRAGELGADRAAILAQLGPVYVAQRRWTEVLAQIPQTGGTAEVNALNLAVRSRAYLGMADLRGAERSVNAALALAPGSAEVLLAASRVAVAQQDEGAASARLEAALKADPDNVEALILKSQALAARNEASAALRNLDRAVTVAPSLAAPRLARAGLLMTAGDDANARKDVDGILALQPRNGSALYLQAVLDVRAQRWGDAAERLQNLGPAGARFPRTAYFQAIAALGQNLPASAVDFAQRYVNQNPNDPDGVRLLSQAQRAVRRPDLAAKTLAEAVARGLNDPRTLAELGNAQESAGDLQGAAASYGKAASQQPDSPAIAADLANLAVRQGEPARAIAALQGPDGALPTEPVKLEALAVALVAAGETERAASALDRLRAATGQTEAVQTLAGMLAMARSEADKAVDIFAAGLKQFPGSAILRLDLAKALVLSGRREEAEAQLAALLAKEPTNPLALNASVQLAVDNNQFASAIRVLQAARAAAPGDDALLAMLADVIVRSGNPARAITELTRAGTIGQTPLLVAALGRAQAAAKQPEAAEASFRASLAQAYEPQTALALADLQQRASRTDAARATLDDLVERVPADMDLLTRRVLLEEQAGGVDAALHIAASLRQAPAQMPDAALLAGDVLMRAKRPSDAAVAFRKELALDPGEPLRRQLTLRLAEALIAADDEPGALAALRPIPEDPSAAVLRSQLDIAARRWPDAARNIERALQARPNDAALLNNLAWSYQMASDPRARATAQRAYLLDPSADNADTLGWILVNQNEAAAAISLLRQAVRQRPADQTIRYHLATALSKSGNLAEARTLLAEALGATATFDGKEEAASLLATLGPAPPR